MYACAVESKKSCGQLRGGPHEAASERGWGEWGEPLPSSLLVSRARAGVLFVPVSGPESARVEFLGVNMHKAGDRDDQT